ncbi:MAG TPA: phosphatidate cytidylyltransferase [Acetivibrio sp.]|nr:phosphatidate cytidylyltransferase [Clostridium sp.]HOQ36456.1 phosphatidate cytidylyltransferase [Acetivibrio sp.]HPT90529.1 phosphatidate cytidylyltransferase [Acetivibrio sp.]HQA57117.1 phosphatidate cytidylyltransferase [Acetivibrio sp.]
MLKTRVASAAVAIFLLIAVVFSGKTVIGISVFFVSIIAMYEYFKALENASYRPVKPVGYFSCLYILLLSLEHFSFGSLNWIKNVLSSEFLSLAVFIMLVASLSCIVFLHRKYNIVDVAVTVFGVFYITFLFSFIVLIRNMENGFFLVWLIFIGAFSTDTFAYFSGLLFGKHKLMPEISPKKTVEGAIGGMLGCTVATTLYGVYLISSGNVSVISLYHYIVLGILCGVISQLGDWAASAIKRFVKVKDYGNIMPGHGGALDRFDSILFTAPVIYYYINFIM